MKKYPYTQADHTPNMDSIANAIGEMEAQLADLLKAVAETERAIKNLVEAYKTAQRDHYRERGE